MTDEIFYSLPKEKLYKGGCLCRSNAEAHFKCSSEMAKSDHWGLANSHLILGYEEGIKAILLFAGFFNIKIDLPIKEFFKDHKIKHKVGSQTDKPYRIIFGLISTLKTFGNNKKQGFAQLLLYCSKLMFTSKDEFWWQNANQRKKEGFYVDYQNNSWISPDQITKEIYEESLSATKPIREFLNFSKNLKIDDHILVQKNRN